MSGSDLLKSCIWASIINCILSILIVKSSFYMVECFTMLQKLECVSLHKQNEFTMYASIHLSQFSVNNLIISVYNYGSTVSLPELQIIFRMSVKSWVKCRTEIDIVLAILRDDNLQHRNQKDYVQPHVIQTALGQKVSTLHSHCKPSVLFCGAEVVFYPSPGWVLNKEVTDTHQRGCK